MVNMPEEVIKTFDNPECEKQKSLTWIATVSDDEQMPHMMPACFVKTVGQDKILIGIAFATQTIANVKLGSKVAVSNATYPNGYMVKGKGTISTEGPLFEDYKTRIENRFKGKIQPKAVLVVDVEEIYHLKPSGDKKRIS
jgi:predicted pyridoxine 5'-phosphate oxidase superfamily flavin-nucleotide-binding protein